MRPVIASGSRNTTVELSLESGSSRGWIGTSMVGACQQRLLLRFAASVLGSSASLQVRHMPKGQREPWDPYLYLCWFQQANTGEVTQHTLISGESHWLLISLYWQACPLLSAGLSCTYQCAEMPQFSRPRLTLYLGIYQVFSMWTELGSPASNDSVKCGHHI